MKVGRVQAHAENLTAEYNLNVLNKWMSVELKERIKRLLEEGMKPGEIARQMGIPVKRVGSRAYKLREQRKLELPQYRPDPKFDQAQEMWAEGVPVNEIAEVYGYNRRRMNGVIERYRKAFGLFPRRWKKSQEIC